MLRPIERGHVLHRAMIGSPLFHVRLKHQSRTLAVLSGNSDEEARQRAQRLAETLFPRGEGITIETA